MPRLLGHDGDLQGAYFAVEVDGMKIAWFTGCSGLSVEFDVAEQDITDGMRQVKRKIPGRAKYSEVTLKRGLTQNQDLQDWFMEVADASTDTPYKSASVIIYDRLQKEIARFNLQQCWPSGLSVSDLNAGSDEVMIEELTIQHEFIDWV